VTKLEGNPHTVLRPRGRPETTATMQSPARRTSTGMLIATADVDDADAADMVGVFQSLLPGTPAGEARRRLAMHGWNLQEALKGVAQEDVMSDAKKRPLTARAISFDGAPLFDGEPLGRDAALLAAEQEREGFAEDADGGQPTVSEDAGTARGNDEARLARLAEATSQLQAQVSEASQACSDLRNQLKDCSSKLQLLEAQHIKCEAIEGLKESLQAAERTAHDLELEVSFALMPLGSPRAPTHALAALAQARAESATLQLSLEKALSKLQTKEELIDPQKTACIELTAKISEMGGKQMELCLRVKERRVGEDVEETARVRPDMVDLTAHTRLAALPTELRACGGCVRSLAVRSEELEALPAWLGELTGLTELRVDGMESYGTLRELPDAVGQLTKLNTLELRGCREMKALPNAVSQLTALRTLELRECPRLAALPQGLRALTGLEGLLIVGCSGLQVPAWVTALTGLRVPFEEWRLRVRNGEGKEEEVLVRVRPDMVDLSAEEHTGLVALPAELRACAGCVRSLAVRSRNLEALPAWLGELTGLTELRVDGMASSCTLRELPDTVGQLKTLITLELRGFPGMTALPDAVSQLTALRTLVLRECSGLAVLPQGLRALTGLEDLLIIGCSKLRVHAWVSALPGLRVPFEERRVRVRNKQGKEVEVVLNSCLLSTPKTSPR
jgi:hypothetical protein